MRDVTKVRTSKPHAKKKKKKKKKNEVNFQKKLLTREVNKQYLACLMTMTEK